MLQEPPPPRLSYGLEMECIVGWLWQHEVNRLEGDGLPPVFRVAARDTVKNGRGQYKDEIAHEIVRKAVQDALTSHGFPSGTVKVGVQNASPYAQQRLRMHTTWSAGEDSSVTEPDDVGVRACGIEIATSVEWDSPASFDILRYAINLLVSKFRIYTNPTCGLHCHIGMGAELLTLESLRRISGLLWSADTILATLSPPWRQLNTYCPSIRKRSALAEQKENEVGHESSTGWTVRPFNCFRYIGLPFRHGESSLLFRETHTGEKTKEAFEKTRRPGCFEPFFDASATLTYSPAGVPESAATCSGSWSKLTENDMKTKYTFETFKSSQAEDREDSVAKIPDSAKRMAGIPRVKLPQWTEDDFIYLEGVNDHYGILTERSSAVDIGVFAGVLKLFEATSSCALSGLLVTPGRANYNFNSYACENIVDPGPGSHRTIEFRQAEGSMSANWVVTYAKICVGLANFAMRASVEEYLKVLANCQRSAEGDNYDVLDLLNDVGLFAEAKVVEKKLLENVTDWGMQFAEDEE